MPTYDYRCEECGDEFEVWQSITDEPLTECPRCGGPVRKVMSPAGIVLKGSGFYKTDNRAARSGARRDGGDTSKDAGKKHAGSDGAGAPGAKPEEKAGTKAGSSTSKD